MLFHGGGNVYYTWFPMGTIHVGSFAVEFTLLKGTMYGLIALVLITVTRRRLGCGTASQAGVRPGPQGIAVA